MHSDSRGMDLTTNGDAVVKLYDAAIDSLLEYRLATGASVKSVIAADADFAMAHCLQGYLLMLFGTRAVHGKAKQALAEAEARAAGITAREAAHIAALRLWLTGDAVKTCAVWDEILLDNPRDLLALRLQHFAYFWLGRSRSLREAPARVLHAYNKSVPGYGYVLGMLAFGHEECGDCAAAEAAGRQAVEMNRDDLWALHAVAHVLETQGRLREGIAWLDRPADAWDDRNPFRGHLWWHLALFHLARGAYDAALDLYDRSISVATSVFYLDIQNCASLLARLTFQGIDIGNRWDGLADQVAERLDDHVLAFTDVHAMLALAAAGRTTAAEQLLSSLRAFAKTPDDSAAVVMEPVAIPLCRAIRAYGAGDYADAVARLLPLRDDIIRLGASHAQRDVFDQLLLESALRGGSTKLARALLSERTLLKPNSIGTWTKYAELMQALGEKAAAQTAHRRAQAVAAA